MATRSTGNNLRCLKSSKFHPSRRPVCCVPETCWFCIITSASAIFMAPASHFLRQNLCHSSIGLTSAFRGSSCSLHLFVIFQSMRLHHPIQTLSVVLVEVSVSAFPYQLYYVNAILFAPHARYSQSFSRCCLRSIWRPPASVKQRIVHIIHMAQFSSPIASDQRL